VRLGRQLRVLTCVTQLIRSHREARTPKSVFGTNVVARRSAFVPRFYFHLRNDMDVPDEQGKEFPSFEAALERATIDAQKLAGEIVKERMW
jgi:hypothetical protein